MNIQIYLDREYEKIFDKVCKEEPEFHELKLEVQFKDGTTYKKSWLDREERIEK